MGNRCQLQGLVDKRDSFGLNIKKTFVKDAGVKADLNICVHSYDGMEMEGKEW